MPHKVTIPIWICLSIILMVFFGCQQNRQLGDDFLVGGIQVNEPNHQHWVNTLSEIGMNTVSVTVYGHQGNWNTDNFWYNDEEPAVISELRAARKKGLKTVLILRVALDHAYPENDFKWHGMIMPDNDYLLYNWFTKYHGFVTKWAKIAEQEKVDVLAIGSELNTLSFTKEIYRLPDLWAYYLDIEKQTKENSRYKPFMHLIDSLRLPLPFSDTSSSLEGYFMQRSLTHQKWAYRVSFQKEDSILMAINNRSEQINNYWLNIIEDTKKAFHGEVTYAANFDNYQDIAFWKELDFMGINAYFQLKDSIGAPKSSEALALKWQAIFNDIDSFQKKSGIQGWPIIFTELGYTFKDYSQVRPWESRGLSVVEQENGKDTLIAWHRRNNNYLDRLQSVQSLHHTCIQRDTNNLLKGILYWKLSTQANHTDIEPFVLHIANPQSDPLQSALVNFNSLK